MDLFSKLRALPSVAQVSNLNNTQDVPLRCTFYICPKMNGFKLNPTKTGFTTHYSVEMADSTKDRLKRAVRFVAEAQAIDIDVQLVALFAAADAELLFPQPVMPPETPKGLRCATNLNTFRAQRSRFWTLYKEEPWLNMPLRFAQAEAERLVTILPTSQQATVRKAFLQRPGSARNVAEDLIVRIFAGFALDGLTLREGCYGKNPILLGVESPGIAALQNAALAREQWLPVIQLH